MKKEKKFRTKKDFLLSLYSESLIYKKFNGDKAKIDEFGNALLLNDALLDEDNNDILNIDANDSIYEKKIEKKLNKKAKTMFELLLNYSEIQELKRKNKKKLKKKSLGNKKDAQIFKYLNGGRYGKKFLSTDKYRKKIKQLAKSEKRDIEEMRKFGLIKNKDVDDELNKLLAADKMMGIALSDSYTQKHFL